MAAQNVIGQGNIGISFIQSDTTGLVTPIVAASTFGALINLVNGTGAVNAIDTLYSAQLTLSAAATHIDLFALNDILGNSVSMLRARFWGVQVVTTTAGHLVNVYTRTGTNPVTWLPITTSGALWAPAGGIVMGYDPISITTNGWVVASGANDFTVDPGANTCVVNVVIAGNSAA